MEKWVEISGFERMYEISDLGNARSVNRFVKSENGRNRFVIGRNIKPKKNKDGYLFITLSKNGLTKNYYLHRLVAETFIVNQNNKPQVNHLNGKKHDNSISNLEWVTISENTKHAYLTGLSQNIGATHYYAKKVIDNCTGKTYDCVKDAANALQMNYSTLRNMLGGSNKNKTCLEYLNKE